MPPIGEALGDLTERITFWSDDPQPLAVVLLETVSSRAYGTTATPHGLATGDYVTVSGATPAAYNVSNRQIIVSTPAQFSYPIDPATATPAGGAPTVLFLTDAQGGGSGAWRAIGSAWAAMIPLSAADQLHAEAIGSTVAYRAVTAYRADLEADMRLEWRPYRAAEARMLEIHGVLPHPSHPRRLLVLEVGEVVE